MTAERQGYMAQDETIYANSGKPEWSVRFPALRLSRHGGYVLFGVEWDSDVDAFDVTIHLGVVEMSLTLPPRGAYS